MYTPKLVRERNFTLGTQLLWWKRNTESSEIKKNYREGRYTIRSMNPELVLAAKSLFVSKN